MVGTICRLERRKVVGGVLSQSKLYVPRKILTYPLNGHFDTKLAWVLRLVFSGKAFRLFILFSHL